MSQKTDLQELVEKGKKAYQNGQFLTAAKIFHDARIEFEAHGDALSSAEMANNSSVSYLKAGQPNAALQELEGVEETFAEHSDLHRYAMTVGNRGAALEALQRLDEAELAYERSAEILEKTGDDVLRASVMQSLSALQLRSGKHLQALTSMQQGLEAINKPSPRQRILKRILNFPFNLLGKNK